MPERRLSPHERAVLEAIAPMTLSVRARTISDYLEQHGWTGWRGGPSATMATLATLQQHGLVTAYWEEDNRHRRFTITAAGRTLLAEPPASEDTHVV